MDKTPLIPNEEKIEEFAFVIRGRVEGQRLDAYLVKRFPDYSRAFLQKMIDAEKVLIDGRPTKPSAKIRVGQQITVRLPKLEPVHLKPESIPLDILYEDESLAILNKQSDLVIHPSRGHLSGTLVNGLLAHFENLSDYHEDVFRPGIVHRLDRFTSGILLIAKNAQAHAILSAQFENREIKKEYLALVEGEMRFEEGTISLPLGIDPKNRERVAVRHNGKEAVTDYRVMARYPGYTLVHVFPKTGRTHQIRVHLKSQGHPIVADQLYGATPSLDAGALFQKANKICATENDCLMERPALHAWRLTFYHPVTHEVMTRIAPLPQDYHRTLQCFQALWPCSKVAKLIECREKET